ncbi:gp14 [Listeria phage A511]|uniref:Gp14 n=1 Tax=Listeria phage A511 TaxID=2908169 RepID=A8AT38_BPA51|nr:gp14 [Listeria phage A511]AAY52985.1 gp14 [Listeria phage A511]
MVLIRIRIRKGGFNMKEKCSIEISYYNGEDKLTGKVV